VLETQSIPETRDSLRKETIHRKARLFLLGGGLDGLASGGVHGSLTLSNLGVWVHLEELLQVGQWVLLGSAALASWADGADNRLDLIGVDKTGNVSVEHLVAWHDVWSGATLLERLVSWGGLRAKEGIEGLESILGPDNEASNVTSWGELEKVEAGDWAELNTWKVAESLDEASVLLVAHKWATTHGVAAVTPLTLASAELLAGLALLDIVVCTDGLEDADGLLGLLEGLHVVGNDEWDLWKLAHSVTAGLDQSWEGRSSESGRSSVTALVLIDAAVPPAPDLGWGEHATLTAHVTEGTLSTSVCTTTGDTWDTGHGTAGTPGLSGVLVTCALVDSVWLATVLGDVGVHEGHDISTDGCLEHSWQSHG
jgi:hypothetical protein